MSIRVRNGSLNVLYASYPSKFQPLRMQDIGTASTRRMRISVTLLVRTTFEPRMRRSRLIGSIEDGVGYK